MKLSHSVLEINIDAIKHNINVFRSMLKPRTKLLAMLKARSYGHGNAEFAYMLQNHIDYFAVAFDDEGIELRKSGISKPIIILAAIPDSFDNIIAHRLEPTIFSFDSLTQFCEAAEKAGVQHYPVHIKIDTGMHRLGFEKTATDELISKIRNNPYLRIRSIFSHLAASNDTLHDRFTRNQLTLFENISAAILQNIPYPVMRHLLNTSGIERFPEAQYDMARLGLGLYGVSLVKQDRLKTVATLSSPIIQIKEIAAGETIGYGRHGKIVTPKRIATVAIGYADGIDRELGNGKGVFRVNGQPASVIGDVCMDMLMIDVTDISAKVGDYVTIFGEEPSVLELSEKIGTIPYELITRVSQRTKRVFTHD